MQVPGSKFEGYPLSICLSLFCGLFELHVIFFPQQQFYYRNYGFRNRYPFTVDPLP